MLSNANHLAANVVRIAAVILCFSAMAACFLWSVIIGLDRVERVNERLPVDQQFETLWWGPMKRLRFESEYVRLFPDRGLRRKERFAFLLGMVFLATLVLSAASLF